MFFSFIWGLEWVTQFNYNISFQTREKLNNNSIIYNNKSYESIKKELGFEKLHILKSRHNENTYCGITDNGHLFLANWENIKNISASELSINSGFTISGIQYLIVGKVGQKFFDTTFSIPVITEKALTLHVHHKFYVKEKLPWEYENEALITLCNWCHWELHEQSKIPIYTLINDELHDLNYIPCKRCNGAGVFPEYKHVINGICFRCNGNLYEDIIATKI